MEVRFEPVAPEGAGDPDLRAQLLRLWVAVTDAGGSVGFTAPAPVDEIRAVLDAALARVADCRDSLGVLRRGGDVVGMGVLVDRGSHLCQHWRTVLRVMVDPALQGSGAGTVLMHGLHELGRDLGLDHLQLTVRDGQHLERFYERFGYTVVGHHPGAVRVQPGDDRDEIMMVAPLH
ncbi:MAG: GNAT family N-acetyltransferase [Jatrophihabitans sp.]